jgi:tetratricopeptide (TPR) repeat protein
MTVWAAAEWASARHFSVKYVATAGLTLLLAFSAVTRIQLGYWHDDLSLWSHALAVTRNNYVAENNFASALVREGRIDEAFVHFQTASALEPSDPTSQLNLGIYAEQHGDLAQAEARYEMALRLATDSQLRATAYANLGTVYFALHDYDRAEQNFDSALKLKGSFSIAFLDLGLIAQKTAQTTGDWSRAADYFAQSVALEPNDVGYLLLASALHHANRIEDANRAYRQALQFSTDLAQSRQRAAQLSAQ